MSFQLRSPPKDAFPDTLALAKLARHVYYVDKVEGQPGGIYELDHGWEIYMSSQSSQLYGYIGVAYQNKESGHIVISHRGTDNVDGVRADAIGVVLNLDDPQIAAACAFTYLIMKSVKAGIGFNVISISVTGHSLGGWLAQLSTFCIEHAHHMKVPLNLLLQSMTNFLSVVFIANIISELGENLEHLHTVVFESPGCKSAMDKIMWYDMYYKICQLKWPVKFDKSTLDITVVLSKINIINLFREQFGRVLQLDVDGHGIIGIVKHLESQNHRITEHCKPSIRTGIFGWFGPVSVTLPRPGAEDVSKTKYLTLGKACRLNIFSKTERKFLSTVHKLRTEGYNITGNRMSDADQRMIREILEILPEFKILSEQNQLELVGEVNARAVEQFISDIRYVLKFERLDWAQMDILN